MLVFLLSSGNFSSITSISVVLFHLFSSPETQIIHMSSFGTSKLISCFLLNCRKFTFPPISDFIFIYNLFTGYYKMNFNVFPLPLRPLSSIPHSSVVFSYGCPCSCIIGVVVMVPRACWSPEAVFSQYLLSGSLECFSLLFISVLFECCWILAF